MKSKAKKREIRVSEMVIKTGSEYQIEQTITDIKTGKIEKTYLPIKPNYLLGTSVKIEKSNHSGKGFLSTVMYIAPSSASGIINPCPFSSPECEKTCLVSSSFHMNMDNSRVARLQRTAYFVHNRQAFKEMLVKEVQKHIKKAKGLGLVPVVRLNGTSDLPWEIIFPDLFIMFPEVIWYDYTKYPITKRTSLPSNYYLLRSRSENNGGDLSAMIQKGNVAVVFDTKKGTPLPPTFQGFPVFDGDVTDLRFLDPKNVIVGLRAKGKAKKLPVGGFVQAGE